MLLHNFKIWQGECRTFYRSYPRSLITSIIDFQNLAVHIIQFHVINDTTWCIRYLIQFDVKNDTSIKGSTFILAPTPEFCKCTFYTNLHICLFYTKVVRTEQMGIDLTRNPDYIRYMLFIFYYDYCFIQRYPR